MADPAPRKPALTPDEARDVILASAGGMTTATTGDLIPLAVETIAIDAAHGRCLAEDVTAKHSQPPFHTTAMDGYAVRAQDVARVPATLKVLGEAAAGRPFGGAVRPGEAVRIFTGAPIPAGADAIVIQENTTSTPPHVTVTQGACDPEHIRPLGGDFQQGATLLRKGQVLTARSVALVAAMGHGQVRVARRPRVAILATGDELQLPGMPLAAGQITASNHLAIAALVRDAGGDPHFLGIARDNRPDLDAKLAQGLGADVLVTIGGASVGDHDLVAPALTALGIDLTFWKIAMRPGKPLMFGRARSDHREQRVLGLPGNPVSAYVCSLLFLVPLVKRLLGQVHVVPVETTLPVTQHLPTNGPRAHYMRARTHMLDGRRVVTPMPHQDSSLLSVLADAECLIVRPIGAGAVPAGTLVPTLPIEL